MADYLYALIRYVPDRNRMEPTNIGVMLQGNGRLDFRLNAHASKRKDYDTATFQRWRKFLTEEIQGQAMPLFQPRKSKPEFFTYLAGLCQGTVVLSQPLFHSATDERPFEEVLNGLYQRLVATLESDSPAESTRANGRFRQIADERKFQQRGMKRHAHVAVGGRKLWMAHRQVDNGELIAIEKVEVANRIGSTANEIERLPLIRQLLPDFLQAGAHTKATRCVVLADELQQPFTDQPPDEFAAMRDDLESEIAALLKLGAEVIRSPDDAERFANDIDAKLPEREIPTGVV